MKKLATVCVFALVLVSLASAAMADPGRGTATQCYVWANNASPAIGVPYTPSNVYSYNSIGRAAGITVTKTAVGVYTVTCRGVGGGALFGGSGTWGPGGHVQVTAYGAEDADYCKVANWTTGGADFSANVRCYNHQGAPSDNRFDLLFVW
ncbi:MAG TPA: hypothetical protein VMW27_23245 [Thermoanaerobaculia bacterium]|nr:hypothetical protein [Thermoanaerobaculia bacterium]